MHDENEKPELGCTPEYCIRPEVNKQLQDIQQNEKEIIANIIRQDDKKTTTDVKHTD